LPGRAAGASLLDNGLGTPRRENARDRPPRPAVPTRDERPVWVPRRPGHRPRPWPRSAISNRKRPPSGDILAFKGSFLDEENRRWAQAGGGVRRRGCPRAYRRSDLILGGLPGPGAPWVASRKPLLPGSPSGCRVGIGPGSQAERAKRARRLEEGPGSIERRRSYRARRVAGPPGRAHPRSGRGVRSIPRPASALGSNLDAPGCRQKPTSPNRGEADRSRERNSRQRSGCPAWGKSAPGARGTP